MGEGNLFNAIAETNPRNNRIRRQTLESSFRRVIRTQTTCDRPDARCARGLGVSPNRPIWNFCLCRVIGSSKTLVLRRIN